MVAIDIGIAKDMSRNRRTKRLKSKSTAGAQPSESSSSTPCNESSSSAPSAYSDQQPPVKYMNLELYQLAAHDKDNVAEFNIVLSRILSEQGLALSQILQQVTPRRNTVLHVASSYGNELIARLIVFHAPSLVMKQNTAGDTALHVAARAGRFYVVTSLLQLREDLGDSDEWIAPLREIPENTKMIRITNGKGNTTLHECILRQPRDDQVERSATWMMIDCDPCVCYLPNNEGKSPLYLAAEMGQQDLVTIMLDCAHGIELKEKHKGKSPFLAAIIKRDTELSNIVLRKEPTFINLQDEDGKTPLHHAASKGYIDMVDYLFAKDASCAMVTDNSGFFPIHLAAAQGHIQVINKLVQFCHDPREMVNFEGQNILHIAAARGKNKVVSFILRTSTFKSLINEVDYEGNTPLHLATMNWHPKIVSTMTWDKLADLGVINNAGLTAFDAAEYYMERSPSFDKRLTWKALKAAGAPRASRKENLKLVQRNYSQLQLSNTSNIDNYKDRVNTLLLVATLVATVTFAAGFTMPGGYSNAGPDQGMATMLQKKAFYVFVFSDTIAMYSSILVAITLIWAQPGDLNLVFIAVQLAIPLLGVALATMSLAFMAGVYLVVSQLNWLAYAVLIMASTFLVALIALFFPLCFPLSFRNCFLRYLTYYPFYLLILVAAKGEDEVAG